MESAFPHIQVSTWSLLGALALLQPPRVLLVDLAVLLQLVLLRVGDLRAADQCEDRLVRVDAADLRAATELSARRRPLPMTFAASDCSGVVLSAKSATTDTSYARPRTRSRAAASSQRLARISSASRAALPFFVVPGWSLTQYLPRASTFGLGEAPFPPMSAALDLLLKRATKIPARPPRTRSSAPPRTARRRAPRTRAPRLCHNHVSRCLQWCAVSFARGGVERGRS